MGCGGESGSGEEEETKLCVESEGMIYSFDGDTIRVDRNKQKRKPEKKETQLGRLKHSRI